MDQLDCWQIVLERDAAFDQAFVYAVRSTGIYCRPSCPSRRPGREQVAFFAQPMDAEQAGFRACRRCYPAGQQNDPQVALVERVCAFISAQADAPPTLGALAAEFHVSPFHLQRLFKRVVGITPWQYGSAQRAARLKAELRTAPTVTHALYAAGYGSSSSLYGQATEQLGMRPTSYRAGGAEQEVRYALSDSPLGRLLVAATAQGICAVSLGDDDAQLVRALGAEYPAAMLVADGAGMEGWIAELLRYLRGQTAHLDLPLDVQATAFKWRVWEALRAIPYGSTCGYAELAARMGQPTAARAVAQACATNPVALIIPCHRVVRGDGGLGGYRWQVERKQALLALEAQGQGAEPRRSV